MTKLEWVVVSLFAARTEVAFAHCREPNCLLRGKVVHEPEFLILHSLYVTINCQLVSRQLVLELVFR